MTERQSHDQRRAWAAEALAQTAVLFHSWALHRRAAEQRARRALRCLGVKIELAPTITGDG